MLQFLMAIVVEPFEALKLAIQIMADEVPVLVLINVKLRVVPPEFEPSMVI
jgi:hypothetical protein